MRAADMLKRGKLGNHEFTVRFHIFHKHFQDVIVIAADMETFRYFIEPHNFAFKPGEKFPGMLCELDVTKYNECLVDFRPVE